MKGKVLFFLVILALVGSLVLAACPGCTTEDKANIKIGVLLAQSESYEQEALHGMQLAFNEVNNEIAGYKVELIVEDYANDPALCLTKVKKLKEMDNVDLILGPQLSSGAMAIRDYIDANKLLTISHMCSTSQIIADDVFTKYFFRSSYNGGYQVSPVGAYVAYEEKDYRKAVLVAMDYVAGYSELEGFKQVFEQLGGQVVQEIYTPVNTLDYSSYVTQIEPDNADFVWSFHYGGDAIGFVKALDDYGITPELPMFFSAATCEYSWLAPQGDSAIGAEDVSQYSVNLETTENNEFVQAIRDEYDEQATLYTEHGYVAAQIAILALQQNNGDVNDVDKLIQTIEELEFVAPRGPISFELHTPVQNVYHRVVQEVDGELQNTVLETYQNIGPYWLPPEIQ